MRLAAKRQWGPSSEACRGQLPLLFNDAEGFADATLLEASPRRTGGKRGRVDWSAHETEVVVHDMAEEDRSCPACDAELAPMGYEVTRELVFVPARVRVVEHRTMKYVCPSCSAANRADGGETPAVVVRAEAPEGPIPGRPAIREKVTATARLGAGHIVYTKTPPSAGADGGERCPRGCSPTTISGGRTR